MSRLSLAALLLFSWVGSVRAELPAVSMMPIDFDRDMQPILS